MNDVHSNNFKFSLFHPKFKRFVEHRSKELIEVSNEVGGSSDLFKYIRRFHEKYTSNESNEVSLRVFLNEHGIEEPAIVAITQEYSQIDNEDLPQEAINSIIKNLDMTIIQHQISQLSQDSEYNENIKKIMSREFSITKQVDGVIDTSLDFDEEVLREKGLAGLSGFNCEPLYTSFLSELNNLSFQRGAKSGYMPNQLIVVAAQPGTGKSLFCMNEAINLISQGAKVCYISVGNDLSKRDFYLRFMSIMGYSFSEENEDNLGEQLSEFRKNNPKIFNEKTFKTIFIPPSKLTAAELVTYLESKGYIDSYDTFFVDYDANFKSEYGSKSENLYLDAGNVYTRLSEISMRNNNLLFIASQIKNSGYNTSKVPIDMLAGSSRKQEIASLILLMGRDSTCRNIMGEINVAKNRTGKERSFHYIKAPNGVIHNIEYNMYSMLKMEDEFRTMEEFNRQVPIKKSGDLFSDLM